jgi:hypothetical protein
MGGGLFALYQRWHVIQNQKLLLFFNRKKVKLYYDFTN